MRLRARLTVLTLSIALDSLLGRQLQPSRADLVMATHDTALGLAARAHGFPVMGIPR